MNWEAIGAVGEIAGALGVIVSLAYLASQIRTQNRESRLAAVGELTNQTNEFLSSLAENPVIADIWIRGVQDFSSLTPTESVQFSSQLGRFLRVVEGLHDQHEQGRLDSGAWRGMERLLDDVARYPGVRAWWPTRSRWYRDEFIAFVQPFMESEGSARMYGEEAHVDRVAPEE